MTEQQQLSGRDLDRAIAEALGIAVVDSPDLEWDDYQRDWVSLYYVGDDGLPREVLWYSADANAQYAVCKERGLCLTVFGGLAVISTPFRIAGEMYDLHHEPEWHANGKDGQEAGARALLLALGATP